MKVAIDEDQEEVSGRCFFIDGKFAFQVSVLFCFRRDHRDRKSRLGVFDKIVYLTSYIYIYIYIYLFSFLIVAELCSLSRAFEVVGAHDFAYRH